MKSIDEIDVAILNSLFSDGRKNLKTIAEECQVSKDIIWKHFMKMKSAGIIVGATVELNYPRFGYNTVANLLLNVESQNINEVFDYLRKIKDVETCRQYNSPYNFVTVSKLRSLKDLERIKEMVCKKNLINEIKTLLWIDVKNLPENILKDSFENEVENSSQKSTQADPIAYDGTMKLDEIDIHIIEKLTKDGKAPFRKIAEELGISTGTVARRYQKLVNNKFIKATIQIDPTKLGYKALVTFLIEITNHDKIRSMIEKLSRIPRVSYVATLAGPYDLRVVALVKELEELYLINEDIEKIPFIKRIETSLRSPRLWPVAQQYMSTI
jgi:Lrp/AsnC family transcriptional regulator, regulator for asnA, asnC and gidA